MVLTNAKESEGQAGIVVSLVPFICLLRSCKCLFCHFNMTGKHTNSMLLSFLDMLYRGRIFGRKTAPFFFFLVSIKSVKRII